MRAFTLFFHIIDLISKQNSYYNWIILQATNNMLYHAKTEQNCEGAADFTQAGYAMSWMCVAWYPVIADRLCLCSVRVVRLNCVKVQCSAYRNVGVCCRVH